MVKQLLAAGADPEIGEVSQRPLELAIYQVRHAAADRIVEAIKETNIPDLAKGGITPAMAILRIIVHSGADPSNGTALHGAAATGEKQLRVSLFNMLLKAGADVNRIVPLRNPSYDSPGKARL